MSALVALALPDPGELLQALLVLLFLVGPAIAKVVKRATEQGPRLPPAPRPGSPREAEPPSRPITWEELLRGEVAPEPEPEPEPDAIERARELAERARGARAEAARAQAEAARRESAHETSLEGTGSLESARSLEADGSLESARSLEADGSLESAPSLELAGSLEGASDESRLGARSLEAAGVAPPLAVLPSGASFDGGEIGAAARSRRARRGALAAAPTSFAEWRRAIVAREVLGPPIAWRAAGEDRWL